MGGFQIPNFAQGTALPGIEGQGGQNQHMTFPSMGANNLGGNFGYMSPYGGGSTYSAAPGMLTMPSNQPTFSNQPSGSQPPGAYPPGVVPPASGTMFPGNNPSQNPQFNPNNIYGAGVGGKLPGGYYTGRTIDPAQTQAFNQFLMNQMGQGASPFNLSAYLPSTGGTTTPGSLTAPMTPTMQNLQDFLMGKSAGVSGVPGTSGPLGYVLPMWQSEIAAMQQPIQQNLANIKEQFGQQGALGSTEMATALANYGQQTALGEQNLLGQLTMQALPQYGQQAGMFQGMDQQSIQNMYNEFIRTRPEYSPLLQEQYGMATTFSPMYAPGGGAKSGLMGALPGLGMNIAGSIGEGLSGGGGMSDVISSLMGMLMAA